MDRQEEDLLDPKDPVAVFATVHFIPCRLIIFYKYVLPGL
jgi:hypothetical protein